MQLKVRFTIYIQCMSVSVLQSHLTDGIFNWLVIRRKEEISFSNN